MPTLIPAAVVHHTGSMIRFRTSQLTLLPANDRDVQVILPHGELINGRFRRHPDNPYIAGAKLVRWIKSQVAFGDITAIDVTRSGDVYFVNWPSAQGVPTGTQDHSFQIERAIKQLLKIATDTPARRRNRYASYLERVPVARLFKELWGDRCQVEDCEFTRGLIPDTFKYVTEVHHLEHLSSGGSNEPLNLCVLCANHHSLFHRDPLAKIVSQTGDEVMLETSSGIRRIARDLSVLEAGT